MMNGNIATATIESELNIFEVINYLKSKNIKFELCNEQEAEYFLKTSKDYDTVVSYRHNFVLYPNGEFKGKFMDVDFAYLKDLSLVDSLVRELLQKMTNEIEENLKLRIKNLVSKIPGEDGLNIVNLFLDQDYYDSRFPKRIHNSIMSKKNDVYYEDIFLKYNLDSGRKITNFPLGKFLKILSFGELINFFDFLTTYYHLEDHKYIPILMDVHKLRNALAHSVCILSILHKKDVKRTPNFLINTFLIECGVSKETRQHKLANSAIRQITSTLYLFNILVKNKGVKRCVNNRINYLFYKRIPLHKEYYVNNPLLKSIYEYFDHIISNYYSNDEEDLFN